jgi:thiamine-monophosphate kinase
MRLLKGRMQLFHAENEFVEWLRAKVWSPGPRVKAGIGDDAAVLAFRRGYEILLKSDMSIEEVHFKAGFHLARSVGHRALARSLSDIAAMGGMPKFALIAIALSQRTAYPWLKSFYAGLLALATRYGVAVVGGDTAVVSHATMVDLVVAGEVEPGRALLRSGARPGDAIYVSGWPGASARGLQLLMGRPRLPLAFLTALRGRTTASRVRTPFNPRHALQSHLYPEPRLTLGRYLLERRLASAAMDVSDGISTDLSRLTEASGVGAVVQLSLFPKPANLQFGRTDWLALALHGGEDYELLFTVSPSKVPLVPPTFQGVPLRRIGEITRSKALRLVGLDGRERGLEPAGYDHFRKA